MNSLSILYIGNDSGTSRHRAQSLGRLGHCVRILDPDAFLPSSRLLNYWIHHSGAIGVERLIQSRMLETVQSEQFDLVWVDSGHLVGAELVRRLKRHARFVINYNVDDPFGRRDGKKWRLYLDAVPFYDLMVVVRDCNVAEAMKAGAKEVLRVHRSSDEVAHSPRKLSPNDRVKWASEVAFVGTWMPERGPFLAALIERGVPLSIWGNGWSRSKQWPILRSHWRGPGLDTESGDEYAMAVQSAKVCIGLLSKGNRDLCTTRSFEIPQLGSVLCAERTSEHRALYAEDVEAVFWNDPDECAEKCRRLLREDGWRDDVARNGQMRAIRNRTGNESVMNQIISRALDLAPVEELLSQ